MNRRFSDKLLSDVVSAVRNAVAGDNVVDISRIAEDVRVLNINENVAREDIERLVLLRAQNLGSAMSFSNEAARLAPGE